MDEPWGAAVKAGRHVVLSLGVATILYATTRSLALSAGSVISGVLIDIDHCTDYLVTYGFRFDIKFFFRSFHEGRYDRMIIPLHGWEFVAAAVVAAWLSGWNPWMTGVAVGLVHHLAADQLTNQVGPLGYLFFWRLSRGFDYRGAFPGKDVKGRVG